ncbi:sigma-70 family RNA polymerase sigma factor [Amycolatopsis sp. La24]|uniref:sigma-70 family RNA polymerase sigma factor n=1 Tax=Amycolatopsis sp. La24 TaxID=3028304 RepID=UPI0023B193D4|nr:sigma-70 family RNA polymerase sigma factor [Amycolatopsis sp. La24]
MSTVPADLSGKSDAELIAEVRAGKIASYGPLYERHSGAAHNLARQLARSSSEADDLVSEAFSKVLDTLRGGKGPDSAFRAYLLTALRHTAYDKTRRDRRIDLNEDMSDVGGAAGEALTVQFSDTAVAGLERTMAAKAFARLPERWQAVLWHTEIEQQSPAEVAPLLGLTANGVSALAYRAREGLRQAYLQVHLQETGADRCRATAERLGAWTRDGLSKRERSQVENHLDECEQCRVLAAELADVNGSLRAIIAPIVLGGAALGYLATIGAAKASAATAGAAAVGAGAAAAGGAKAGAAAAASAPRQFAGVAMSGAAMVAAVAVALAAGGGTQTIPTAQQAPAPPAAAPAPAPKPAPAPPPAAPPAPPAPPPAQPAPPAVPPPAAPPAAPPAQPPAQNPPAAPPQLSASMPPSGVELQPGGGPVALPITVRNNGGSVSEPVQATLNLPPGVRAVQANGGGAAGAYSSEAAAQSGPMQVACPGGEGTVTCKTGSGLQPGQSAVLMFRLQADDSAKGGEVTGSVTAGASVNVNVTVQVKVKAPNDSVTLVSADTDILGKLPWSQHPSIYVDVQNSGESTKPVTVTFDQKLLNWLPFGKFTCRPAGDNAVCTTNSGLEPGNHAHLWVKLARRPMPSNPLHVTAALGSSQDTKEVAFKSCVPGICDWPRPTSTSSEPASTSSSSKETTSSTSWSPHHSTKHSATPPSTDDETPDQTSSSPAATTSAPPNPGSDSKPGKPDNHGKRPPSVEPRGFFGWVTE